MLTQTQTIILTAVATGIITAIGWYVSYIFSKRKEIEIRRQEAALHHLQVQIEEFYGPLLGLIQYRLYIYEVATERLPIKIVDGRKIVARISFSPEDTKIWHYLIDTYFIPINEQISELLRTKIYLLESAEIPDSFQQFLRYDAYFQSLHRMWSVKGIGSTSIRGPGWPLEFENDVKVSLNKLRERYKNYLQKLGLL